MCGEQRHRGGVVARVCSVPGAVGGRHALDLDGWL
jgi:hypothetical protein